MQGKILGIPFILIILWFLIVLPLSLLLLANITVSKEIVTMIKRQEIPVIVSPTPELTPTVVEPTKTKVKPVVTVTPEVGTESGVLQ
jgi:hypothetical protein